MREVIKIGDDKSYSIETGKTLFVYDHGVDFARIDANGGKEQVFRLATLGTLETVTYETGLNSERKTERLRVSPAGTDPATMISLQPMM